jgi:hypothetical protein
MTERTKFEYLRENLNPDYAELSDQRIETLLRGRNMDAEAMEGFFDDLGKFAKSAGKTILKAAPAILPVAGGVIGTAFGGPVGAMIGQKLGSLAGGAVGAATGQRPAAGGAAGAGGLGGLLGGLGGLIGGGGSPAAGQLLQTLVKPQTIQAVSSMALGSLGRANIPVGGTNVPVSAFTNLLSTLAGRAEAEYNASMLPGQTSVPRYMQDYAGEAKGDPAVAEHRAEALYELLESAESGSEGWETTEASETIEAQEWEAIEAEYEALEAELYEAESEEA